MIRAVRGGVGIVADYLQQAAIWNEIPRRRTVRRDRRTRGSPPMSAHEHPGSHDPQLSEQDLALATLVGRHVERRESGGAPCAHDLIAVAAQFGDDAVDQLRTLLVFYAAMRDKPSPTHSERAWSARGAAADVRT